MAETIADHVVRGLAAFRGLVDPATVLNFPEPWILRKIQDEETKFKVWAGNLGAHKTGTASLDYRLRDASPIKSQVVDLLKDLISMLSDATAIASGEKTPWDQLGDDEEEDEDSPDDVDTDSPSTELGQIATEGVADVVDCLLRLSMTIRNPAPHDRNRYAKLQSADMSYFEPFDIQHVQSKFPTIEPWLAERLGKAISRRRQYFRYRESHHSKLSYGLDNPDHATRECNKTIASSLPGHLKDNLSNSKPAILEDDRSDAGMSQTSYATSMTDPEVLRIPPLPEEAHSGPFECCFCYFLIVATNRGAWKKHVYSDLQPYICLEKDCTASGQEFSRRHEWMNHVKQNHWNAYACFFGCSSMFASASKCKEHLSKEHPGLFAKDDLNGLVQLAAKPLDIRDGIPCPFCSDKEILTSEKQYLRHVGRHQEKLSIFALPRTSTEQNDDGKSNSAAEEGSGRTASEPPGAGPKGKNVEVASFGDSSQASGLAHHSHSQPHSRASSEASYNEALDTQDFGMVQDYEKEREQAWEGRTSGTWSKASAAETSKMLGKRGGEEKSMEVHLLCKKIRKEIQEHHQRRIKDLEMRLEAIDQARIKAEKSAREQAKSDASTWGNTLLHEA